MGCNNVTVVEVVHVRLKKLFTVCAHCGECGPDYSCNSDPIAASDVRMTGSFSSNCKIRFDQSFTLVPLLWKKD